MKKLFNSVLSVAVLGLCIISITPEQTEQVTSNTAIFKVQGNAEFALNKSKEQVIKASQFKVAENAFFG
ncbi:hypothetical protein P9D47_06735 [Bacillus haynesii]|uniref:hypothetical protein n=1 Tax=Bacillus haynesii TaxID=1925021 RepID=UPI001594A135|nr:hypothetical protein [Bacillus haynesii]NVB35768.1 hypothetical protein [Bacillus licheniformis]MCY7779115.1 hypothetical protein [Bacillus haynesii]MEC0672177.1 hypothetical protein [Bacillus haynesii]MEC1420143.1 hypothetical protein [Bacillus haynesii]MEC1467738.1 hypothetical protein [Bacillus haynesii]